MHADTCEQGRRAACSLPCPTPKPWRPLLWRPLLVESGTIPGVCDAEQSRAGLWREEEGPPGLAPGAPCCCAHRAHVIFCSFHSSAVAEIPHTEVSRLLPDLGLTCPSSGPSSHREGDRAWLHPHFSQSTLMGNPRRCLLFPSSLLRCFLVRVGTQPLSLLPLGL